jgi:arginyl-tRNA synthetase
MSLSEFKNRIREIASETIGHELTTDFDVDYASDPKFGDFSTNLAMASARALKQNPRELAAKLVEPLRSGIAGAEQVEVAGPGFINIRMSQNYWCACLEAINEEYAMNDAGHGLKTQVEYISANPTGPLTIGNARGGFIGDVLSNVLAWSGYEVEREYYFNDAGTQVDKLLESVKMEAGILPETDERQYRGEYIRDIAAHFAEDLHNKSDDELKGLITRYIIAKYIKPGTKAMGIDFDVWFNEKDLIENGAFKDTLKRLNQLGLVFERDGATWLKTGELGDERGERVIIKSSGIPTYMAPDIAYHANIFGVRNFDYAIKVLGPDHIAQFPSVYAAVHALFPDKQFKMAGYQWLRIVKDGKEVKVSKRLGQFITVQDLIEQVSMPVARFLTLMRSAESHMDFDLDLAKEQSAKNPYYYVMYAYARANSILEKAAKRDLKPATSAKQLSREEIAMVRQMTRLEDMVPMMANDYGVHRLTFYGLELAKLFTEFYDSARIIDLPQDEAGGRLLLVSRFVTFMDVYWGLLGIVPQKRMEHEPQG